MTKDVIHSVRSDSTVETAAERMNQVQRGCLVVMDGGKLVGIVTERDLVQRVMAKGYMPDKVRISEIMSKPVITVGPEALLTDAARIMMENRIRRLPVIEGFDVVGMLTVTDFAKYLSKRMGQDPMLAAMSRAAVLLAEH